MHPKSHSSHHEQCTSNSLPLSLLNLPTLFLHSNPLLPPLLSSPRPSLLHSIHQRQNPHTPMEVSTKQLLPMPPHQQDPNSPSSSTSSSSSSSTSPSHPGHHRAHPQPAHNHSLPPSPRPIPRTIDTTPFPTTFVQADTTSFKQVVQMLTGADQPAAKTDATNPTTPAAAANGGQACRPKKPSFKLYERRSSMKNLKMIAPLAMGPPPSPRTRATAPEILSPSVLDFPSLRLSSPVTPLTGDPFNRSPASSEEAERAAIAERGFFLHPSPRGAADPPRLLPLFPVTSPRMAAASAAAPSE